MGFRVSILALRLGAAGALALVGTSAACSDDDRPPSGQLVLAIQSDLSIPKDIDAYDLEVTAYGKTVLDDRRPLGPDGDRIPTTVTLGAGKRSTDPVRIRLTALKRGEPRFVREVVTTVPHDRVAMLRLPIDYLCLDRVVVADDGSVESDCGDGATCVAGACREQEIDAEALPDFEAPRVFGGGSTDGGGACFDTIGCFSKGQKASVDLSSCTVSTPEDSVNVALVMEAGSAGICSGPRCLVPLDRDAETGWELNASGDVRLPPAACEQLAGGPALALAISGACEPKTPETPLCGSWSSVDPPMPLDPDAGLELDLDAGAADDAGAVDDAGPEAAVPVGSPPRRLSGPKRHTVGGVSGADLSIIGTITPIVTDAGSSVLEGGAR